MEFLAFLFGPAVMGPVSSVAAVLGISQFVYGVVSNKRDIAEIKKKADDDVCIYEDKKYKARFKPAYQALAKSTPYAQRVIMTLQIRAAIVFICSLAILLSLFQGVNFLGKSIINNPVYYAYAVLVFIIIVNWWVPNLSNILNQAKGKILAHSPDSISTSEDIKNAYKDIQEKYSKPVREIFRYLGIIPLSRNEKLFMSSYLTTLEILRTIEAEYLREEMKQQQTALIEWIDSEP